MVQPLLGGREPVARLPVVQRRRLEGPHGAELLDESGRELLGAELGLRRHLGGRHSCSNHGENERANQDRKSSSKHAISLVVIVTRTAQPGPNVAAYLPTATSGGVLTPSFQRSPQDPRSVRHGTLPE